MLMREAAKARLPGEGRGDGGMKRKEGAQWKRKKQTEAGVNYGCNLRFPRGKERQRETSSHAYQIAHLPHFLIMVGEQTHIQSAPRARVLEREPLHITHVSSREAVLCCQASFELNMMRVYSCFESCRTIFASRRAASVLTLSPKCSANEWRTL